jgi:hypothetical protein
VLTAELYFDFLRRILRQGAGQCPAYNLYSRGGRMVLPKFVRWPAPLSELAVFGVDA